MGLAEDNSRRRPGVRKKPEFQQTNRGASFEGRVLQIIEGRMV